MDLQTFKQRREALLLAEPRYRNLCTMCRQPEFGCYCRHIQKFDPRIKFVILIHPIEVKRRIATGRMSHLCLKNSELIIGRDYSHDAIVNRLLENPIYQPAVLYPGPQALNLTACAPETRSTFFAPEKTPLIFVIDGTWATARKTMHLSRNLKTLPRLSFSPPHKSQFRVRKQPGAECFSTIEAIHHLLELLGGRPGFNPADREQDRLLFVFEKMVERQLDFVRDAFRNPREQHSYRRPKRARVSPDSRASATE